MQQMIQEIKTKTGPTMYKMVQSNAMFRWRQITSETKPENVSSANDNYPESILWGGGWGAFPIAEKASLDARRLVVSILSITTTMNEGGCPLLCERPTATSRNNGQT